MSKKLFLILSLIITTGCNFLGDHGGWKKLGSTDELNYYIKTSTITKKENMSSGMFKFDYYTLQDFSEADISEADLRKNKKLKNMKGYKSEIFLMEADCSKYKFYYRGQRLFNEEGKEIFESKLNESYNIKPSSVGEKIYDTLCQ